MRKSINIAVMYGRTKRFLLLLVLLFCNRIIAQDIHFSQFYMTPLALNPANAAAERKEFKAIMNYKDQWRSVASPYKTIAFACDKRIQKRKSARDFWGVGISVFNDKAGDINMKLFQANLAGSYHIFLNKRKFSSIGAGLQSGFAQRSISYEKATWGNQFDGNSFDPSLPTGEPNGSFSYCYADLLGGGVMWSYNNTSGKIKVTDNHDMKVNLGISAFHLLRPGYSFYDSGEKLYVKYVISGNSLISLPNSNIAFAPGFMFYKQGPARELLSGTLIRFKLKQASKYTGYYKSTAVSVGAFMRMKDAIAPALLIEHAEYSIGLSYDMNISDLKVASSGRGGFEISIKYQKSEPYGGTAKF